MRRWALGALAATLLTAASDPAADDSVLKAMRDELARARALKLENLEPPYYVEYALNDGQNFTAHAYLGGIVSSSHVRFRFPEVRVRVGAYEFDNTNYVGSSFPFGTRYDLNPFPIEDNYTVLRRYLWLASDSVYKSAVEALSRKRAALRNLTVTEKLPDFSKAAALRHIEEIRPVKYDHLGAAALARAIARAFTATPDVRAADVDIDAVTNVRRFVNSEGAEARFPEGGVTVRLRVSGQAADGMTLRDGTLLYTLDIALPAEAALQQIAQRMAANVAALVKASVAETYTGPVLFEGMAGAQLVAEVLGRNFALTRRPVTEPGRPGAFPYSELDGRQGARILPEWMDVVDDPTQTEWRGRRLIGHYRVDREGVEPKPVALVEKGVLKNFLLTRQPVRGAGGSNGRARLPGSFGANAATASNLFVSAAETSTLAALKQKVIEICNTRGKPYGYVIRKMDFPSSASFEELRRIASGAAQSGGSRPVSIPLLAYRLYPDGREELVRGLRFRGLNTRSLKDILAAGDDSTVFEYLENNAPFALMGAPGFSAEIAVVAPSLLVDDLELHRLDEEQPKLPIVPPPQ
jgi:hypothetical protein